MISDDIQTAAPARAGAGVWGCHGRWTCAMNQIPHPEPRRRPDGLGEPGPGGRLEAYLQRRRHRQWRSRGS